MIKIMLQFNGKNLTLPINPEELNITQSADNEDIKIIGLGSATRKGAPGLRKLSIESFFPAPHSYFYSGVSPKTCIDFIKTLWNTENKNNNVGKIVTSDLPENLNMYFVIEEFDYDHKAGEEDDVYYTLSIKEYVPYGVKTVKVQNSGLKAARAASPVKKVEAPPTPIVPTNRTYTVVRGDCLWSITKACCGDGSRWRELYELNTDVIGANPNLIYAGQVLILPTGW